MKREAKTLLDKATASLILSTEHFNRPSDLGRVHIVLILMDHSFEMLLKAAILHRGGRIRKKREKLTIGFDACVRMGLSDPSIKFLTEEDALLLQANNGLRDAAQHHTLSVSEQQLYIQCQAGLSLFRKLMAEVFGKDLRTSLPARVLPLSTTVPTDLATVFDTEIEEIRRLLRPGTRHRIEAVDKLRALAIFEASLNGEHVQPSTSELEELGRSVQTGATWQNLFPGVASIEITATGQGPSLDLRITKREGTPVALVKEGTPGASVVAIRRVNEIDFYSLGARALAEKVSLSVPQTLAVVEYLGLQSDQDCFKTFQIGTQVHKRYSQHAIPKIQAVATPENLPGIVESYKEKRRVKRPRTRN